MTRTTTDPLAFLIITSTGATEDSIYPPLEEPADAKPAAAVVERRQHPRSIEPQPQPVLRLVG